MSESELYTLYRELEECRAEVEKVTLKLDELEKRKSDLPLERYLEEFDQIADEAKRLNTVQEMLGEKIKQLAKEF